MNFPPKVAVSRLVNSLKGADFPEQVTCSVFWLSGTSLGTDLIQVGLYKAEGHLVAGCAGDRMRR